MNYPYKISVIIPIYGVEKFIERCANSLLNQSMNDIEFLFIDDCTPDNSIEILNRVIEIKRPRFAVKNWSVKIAKMPVNSGLPTVRRHGIQLASGEYTIHCDSDDWVSPDIYRLLYERAKEDDADIVSCSYYLSDGVKSETVTIEHKTGLLTGPLWNRLVRSTLYKDNEIIYPVASKAEDGALMTQLSYYANKFSFVDEPLYYYFQNPDSICHVMTEAAIMKRFDDEKKNTDLRIEFLTKQNSLKEYKTDILIWKCVARDVLLPLIGNKKYYKLWYNTYPEINKEFLLDSGISIRKKMGFIARLLKLYKKNNRTN